MRFDSWKRDVYEAPSFVHGFGVFAKRNMKAGTALVFRGLEHGFNHSGNPNTANCPDGFIRLTRDAVEGEELMIDYAAPRLLQMRRVSDRAANSPFNLTRLIRARLMERT